MGSTTGIQWTNATWNPIRGCSRVSEGCRHCYAETMAARFCDEGMPYHGLATRKTVEVKVAATLTKRPDGTIDQKSQFKTISQARWTGEVRFVPEHLADPIRWLKPRRIFVNSMSDLFHEKLTNLEITAVFGVMAATPRHTFQVLTKRAKRMREWFEWLAGTMRENGDKTMSEALLRQFWTSIAANPALGVNNAKNFDHKMRESISSAPWPLPNVWMGVSVENQEAANERIPDLLATPAATRFLSCEPLISRVSLLEWVTEPTGNFRTFKGKRQFENVTKLGHGLDLVIAGCESGPGMRPCEPNWLRTLRDECRVGNVKYFLKQATAAQEGGHRLYPSGQAARAEIRYVVKAGDGSTTKPGGVIGLPYLDDQQHTDLPA